MAIAEAGAIPPLVALLHSSSTSVQEQAAGALCNLAATADNHVAITEAGAVLCQLKQSSASAGVQERAPDVLQELGC